MRKLNLTSAAFSAEKILDPAILFAPASKNFIFAGRSRG